ncbi:MAG: hypothetical protein ACTIB2_08920 [Brachybacterium tyrofermentans]
MSENAEGAAEAVTYLSEIEQQFISDMGDMVANHEVRLEALEEKEETPKIPRDWITRNRQVQAWEQLAVWVDWLNANYSMPHGNRVPQCWPAHPGMVHVLAALRSAWRAAVLTDESSKEQGNAMAAFHDYHLFPFFNRLANPLLFPCVKASSHREDTEHTATDRDLFPSDLSSGDDEDTAPDGGEAATDHDDPLPASPDAAGDLEDDNEWWKSE